MTSKPPFYPQETPDSCVPACLRMVLAGFEIMMSEAKLRQLCDCTIFGTTALQAVEAARQLGFGKTQKENLTFTQLDHVLKQNVYPIVYVDTAPIDQVPGIHALVLIETNENSITLLDPLVGKRQLQLSVFKSALQLTNGLTILVRRA